MYTIKNINPLKTFRETHGITQKDMASVANVQISVVSRTENGTYAAIPPSILYAVKLMGSLTAADISQLTQNYALWVENELRKVVLPVQIIDPDTDTTPEQFEVWRELVCKINGIPNTQISFAGLMKVNTYIIEKFEGGKMKQIPAQILERIRFIRESHDEQK